jgi:alginate O-acetyltransferase complex protein AlgI
MLFNSFEFLLFYILVVALFFALPAQRRWMLLLGASYLFYMSWKVEYVVLIVAVTLINYVTALGMERIRGIGARRALLTVGIGSSLSMLFTYKYLNFFSGNIQQAFRIIDIDTTLPVFEFILPLGISFYTFQALGYAVDVYRGQIRAERHLGIFALYVSFFPQLVAGPIERSYNLIPQFRRATRLEPSRIATGLRLILWGLFKKVVVADTLATAVDHVYAAPEAYSGPYLLLATLFFSIQIYCDFSGYSDMAIGTARIMGYDLMTNFSRPYFAATVSEFWRRWHISLSTWFRDYIYMPLGGNRVSRASWIRNILVVFLLSGAWHGANWTFIAWGAIHGLSMILSRFTQPARNVLASRSGLASLPRLHHALRVLFVCCVAGTAWTFFRAQSIEEAVSIISRFSDFEGSHISTLWSLGLSRFRLATAFASIVLLFTVEWIQENKPDSILRLWQKRPFRWFCYLALFHTIVDFGIFGHMEFIYFQF